MVTHFKETEKGRDQMCEAVENYAKEYAKRHAEEYAKENGFARTYIPSEHIGLYEKYGCEFYQIMNDIGGEPSRIYCKDL